MMDSIYRDLDQSRIDRIKTITDILMKSCSYRGNICPCEICIDINKDNCIRKSVNKPCPCKLCKKNEMGFREGELHKTQK